MLSENNVLNRKPKEAYPKLEQPRTVRVKFRKVGNLQYISHLDLQRTISRVLVRAGIPMWYTQGFNPHAKMTFGLPLSVGAESLCEYLDLRIDRDMSCEDIKQRLNAALTDELCVLDAYTAPEKSVFSDIVWARYDIRLDVPGATDDLAEHVRIYLTTSPLMMGKKSKSGVREVDITTLIRSLDVHVADGQIILGAVLCVSGSDYLNPEYLINAMRDSLNILDKNDLDESYTIMRNRFLLSDMSIFI